jgi:hypothetical protein
MKLTMKEKKMKEQYTLHLNEAKEMQDSLKIEIEWATASPHMGLVVLTVDLQQAVPTHLKAIL